MSDKVVYEWKGNKRYNDFSTSFKSNFKGRVQKVSIDAGFTCPNRDGRSGVGGCNYCNNVTFKPSYTNLKTSVTDQINKGVVFFSKKYDPIDFLAYFQAFSNTYAPIEILERLYQEALDHPRVVGIVVATRPDCLTVEVLDLLEKFAENFYVMIELGVESTENDTLIAINRGHLFEESVRAIEECSKRNIHTCAHLILGLPGESEETLLMQAEKVSKLPVENIKLHQLQIHKGTVMANQYRDTPSMFNLHSAEEYMELVIKYLERLRPSIIVERFVSTAPPEMLIAPRWGLKNFEFIDKVDKRLVELDTWQGRLYRGE